MPAAVPCATRKKILLKDFLLRTPLQMQRPESPSETKKEEEKKAALGGGTVLPVVLHLYLVSRFLMQYK
jgi:hypothetical protein